MKTYSNQRLETLNLPQSEVESNCPMPTNRKIIDLKQMNQLKQQCLLVFGGLQVSPVYYQSKNFESADIRSKQRIMLKSSLEHINKSSDLENLFSQFVYSIVMQTVGKIITHKGSDRETKEKCYQWKVSISFEVLNLFCFWRNGDEN